MDTTDPGDPALPEFGSLVIATGPTPTPTPTSAAETVPAPAVPAQRRPPDDVPAYRAAPGRPAPGRPADPAWAWPAVLVLAALAGVCYAWELTHDGLEIYYAASVRSMAGSWHAFWFGGFDRAGTVTLDKLPIGLWPQALLVRAFGTSTAALVAPQIAAGTAGVVAMFVAVRRMASARVGLVAAAAFATMPAVAVMSRGNTVDAIYVLLLVLAAGAMVTAIRTGRLRTLLLVALYVGIAFNVKMLAAFVVLPGFLGAYVLAAPGSRRRRFGHLGLAAALLAVVSLAWMTAVTLVPASDRPYVDGSRDNSVFSQVFLFNGVQRFGHQEAFGLATDLPYRPSDLAVAYTAEVHEANTPVASRSDPTWTRLVSAPLGGDAGWLLPLGLLAAVAGVWSRRGRDRTDIVRAGLLVFGFWLALSAFAVSFGAEALSYYTGAVAPPLAAVCAVGLWLAVRAARATTADAVRRTAPAAFAVAGAAGEWLVVRVPAADWITVTVLAASALGIVAAVTAGVIGPAARRRVAVSRALAAVVVVGLLVGPGATSAGYASEWGGEFDAPFTGASRTLVPAAAGVPRVAGYGGVVLPHMGPGTWLALDAMHRDIARLTSGGHIVLVFTSAEASLFEMTGTPGIVPVGGFTGLIDAPTIDEIRRLLAAGTVSGAIVPGPGDVRANDPRLVLITQVCARAGGPAAAQVVTGGPVYYDCRGAAAIIRGSG